jgi:hypothetical protein
MRHDAEPSGRPIRLPAALATIAALAAANLTLSLIWTAIARVWASPDESLTVLMLALIVAVDAGWLVVRKTPVELAAAITAFCAFADMTLVAIAVGLRVAPWPGPV